MAVADIADKARQALKDRQLKPANDLDLIEQGLAEKILSAAEAQKLRAAYNAMLKAIAVDDF